MSREELLPRSMLVGVLDQLMASEGKVKRIRKAGKPVSMQIGESEQAAGKQANR